jgi:hypothetical protein
VAEGSTTPVVSATFSAVDLGSTTLVDTLSTRRSADSERGRGACENVYVSINVPQEASDKRTHTTDLFIGPVCLDPGDAARALRTLTPWFLGLAFGLLLAFVFARRPAISPSEASVLEVELEGLSACSPVAPLAFRTCRCRHHEAISGRGLPDI